MECQNHESPESFCFICHILLTKVHFGENINSEGGNKMIFTVTCWTPENSMNQAPNFPSTPVNRDSMVRKQWQKILRNLSQQKCSVRLRKHRETGGTGSEPGLVGCIICLLKTEGKDLLVPGLRRSPGGGHGKPLQYSCLENPMDRGARQVTVCGVTKSQTWLQWFSTLAQSLSKSQHSS